MDWQQSQLEEIGKLHEQTFSHRQDQTFIVSKTNGRTRLNEYSTGSGEKALPKPKGQSSVMALERALKIVQDNQLRLDER